MEALGYLLAVLMGIVLNLTGAGGAILTVPILVYFMKIPPTVATGYSLLLVGSSALISGIGYYLKRSVDLKAMIIFAIPSMSAVYITRRWLLPAIPDPLFSLGDFVLSKDLFIMLLFSSLMLISSLFMIKDNASLKPQNKKKTISNILLIGSKAIILGIFAGIVGAGGGFLIVPTLVLLVGLEMKVAVGTSLLIIALQSLLGFVGDLQGSIEINIKLLTLFFICTQIGMLIGTKLSTHISGQKLKQMFGWLTLLMAIAIISKEL